MTIVECFRIDYPSGCWEPDTAPAEEEPIGFYLGPAGAERSGLRVLIGNDAEQIEVHLDSRSNLLLPEPDYFGEPSPIKPTSPLHRLMGQQLNQLYIGHCTEVDGERLSTAIQLVFEHDILCFVNNGDEGLYFWKNDQRYTDYFAFYGAVVYTDFEWVEYSHWLNLLATDTVNMPCRLV